mmetsp:Transcript_13704/g.22834  ORF Transcript_13704/g.22834 Transcript_13704/m.22834 type:complete len:506 (-) Transcript_13704:838-2355(-)
MSETSATRIVGNVLLFTVPVLAFVYYRNKLNTPDIEHAVAKLPRTSSFKKSQSFYESEVDEDDTPTGASPWMALGLEQPLVIAMVGLPARGKSYIVKMTIRYLKWVGFESKVFNVGAYRRKLGLAAAESNFFDASNEDGKKVREEMAAAVQDEMYKWLQGGTDHSKRRVAVFDATNTTIKRRSKLANRARRENVFLLFVESICNNQEVLHRNYELKLQNEDYKGMPIEKARADFMDRVHAYEKVYETIEDYEDNNNICYIKLFDVGEKVVARNCHGYLPSQVAFYLQNIHILPRKIYLSIIAEGVEQRLNAANRVPGRESGELTPQGQAYGNSLAEYIRYEQQTDLVGCGKEILVLTGTGNIHSETVSYLKKQGFRICHTPLLNELRGGDFHGMSKAEIQEKHPEEHAKRVADKLNYRYPGIAGESYIDVIERVRPVIIELERQKRSIVLVCHVAVLRCIYAYFMGVPLNDIPTKEFLMHNVYELAPGPFGCTCAVIDPLVQVHD